MRRRKPWGPPHKPFGRPKAHPRRHRFTKPRACAQYLVPPEEERPEVCEKVQASLLCVRVEHATTNQRPSPWQASAGTSHGRLGRTMEDQQGQNSGSYMPRSPLPSSAQDHPGHPEPSSLLTEFVDGFEGPPSPASGLLSVRATDEYLGVLSHDRLFTRSHTTASLRTSLERHSNPPGRPRSVPGAARRVNRQRNKAWQT